MARRSDAVVRKPTSAVQVTAIGRDASVRRPDRVATEEPLEIRLHGPDEAPAPVAVTMRTPGHDFELAVGFCHSEGLIGSADDLASVAYCLGPDGEQEFNVVTIAARQRVAGAIRPRSFAANASCGLCGKQQLADLAAQCDVITSDVRFPQSVVLSIPDRVRPQQTLFDDTGGVHAAALVSNDGSVHLVREDVGRHNAVDKVVGRSLLDRVLPLSSFALFVSGRASYEIVQKAAVASIPVVVAVSAPSSLAVDTARRFGVTLVGFLRSGSANVYCGEERIVAD
jgi:FdhD protein